MVRSYISEANWGSSAQAQVFVSALKGLQTLTETQEHVKNYRPKVSTTPRIIRWLKRITGQYYFITMYFLN
jgi:hypothetical protein